MDWGFDTSPPPSSSNDRPAASGGWIDSDDDNFSGYETTQTLAIEKTILAIIECELCCDCPNLADLRCLPECSCHQSFYVPSASPLIAKSTMSTSTAVVKKVHYCEVKLSTYVCCTSCIDELTRIAGQTDTYDYGDNANPSLPDEKGHVTTKFLCSAKKALKSLSADAVVALKAAVKALDHVTEVTFEVSDAEILVVTTRSVSHTLLMAPLASVLASVHLAEDMGAFVPIFEVNLRCPSCKKAYRARQLSDVRGQNTSKFPYHVDFGFHNKVVGLLGGDKNMDLTGAAVLGFQESEDGEVARELMEKDPLFKQQRKDEEFVRKLVEEEEQKRHAPPDVKIDEETERFIRELQQADRNSLREEEKERQRLRDDEEKKNLEFIASQGWGDDGGGGAGSNDSDIEICDAKGKRYRGQTTLAEGGFGVKAKKSNH